MTPKPLIEDIQIVVARHYGLTLADLRGNRRHRRIVRPRQIAMHLAREMTGRSWPEIGRLFNRHHSTVLHDVRCAQARIIEDQREKRTAQALARDVERYVDARIGTARLAA